LLSFIGNRQSDEIGMSHLDSKCVYAKLSKMGAPIHKPHSELWFLPDKDLYDNDAYCKEGICKNLKVKKIIVKMKMMRRTTVYLILNHSQEGWRFY